MCRSHFFREQITLVSVSLIIIVGLLLSSIAKKVNLPSLIGLLFTGILLGPYSLNLLSPEFLDLSSEFRTIALIVILTRAGLSLDLSDLKKVGRPAILMCFVPAIFEILGTAILAPLFLPLSVSEALLLGSIIAAVIVPRMIRLMNEGYGKTKRIPQIILASASVEDVFALVLFTVFLGINTGEAFSVIQLTSIPTAIISGALVGLLTGYLLVKLFNRIHIRDSVKALILLAISFLLMGLETRLESSFPFSGMLSVMSVSVMIFRHKNHLLRDYPLSLIKCGL